MTELKIVVTKKNKEKLFRFLSELLDGEEESVLSFEIGGEKTATKPPGTSKAAEESKSYLRMPSEPIAIQFKKPTIAKSDTGTWAMFNSFIPGKATLRVLVNMLQENNGNPVKFDSLISKCSEVFEDAGFSKYRGFPSSKKDSATGRLAWHLIRPFADMGLIAIEKIDSKEYVSITEIGLEFAKLPNPLLDSDIPNPALSEEERNWLKNHLKKIDAEGFKEYSLLYSLAIFLKEKERDRNELVKWFMENLNEKENISSTYVGGKIALLRELGVVGEGRGNYKVIGRLNGDI